MFYYNINNDDLSENIVLKDIYEGDVIVTVALLKGYEPIKIDGKYYGEKRTTVTKPAIRKTIYGLTKEELEIYNVIDKKGVNKTNPEDTISLTANSQYRGESGWTLSGSYQRKTIISQVPATVVRITKTNNTYRIK